MLKKNYFKILLIIIVPILLILILFSFIEYRDKINNFKKNLDFSYDILYSEAGYTCKISNKIKHLNIAKRIADNNILDSELIDIFDNNNETSDLDRDLTIILAGYINATKNGISDNFLNKTIEEAEGLSDEEKMCLKEIIEKYYKK